MHFAQTALFRVRLSSKRNVYNARFMHWTDEFHRLLISVSDLTNRWDIDGRLLAASGVKLDRALFPLLSRIRLNDKITTVELANLVGRDHSTVSRQIDKLVQLELVNRVPSEKDRRIRHLVPSTRGEEVLEAVALVRTRWIEQSFSEWSDDDRDQLIGLMGRMARGHDRLTDRE